MLSDHIFLNQEEDFNSPDFDSYFYGIGFMSTSLSSKDWTKKAFSISSFSVSPVTRASTSFSSRPKFLLEFLLLLKKILSCYPWLFLASHILRYLMLTSSSHPCIDSHFYTLHRKAASAMLKASAPDAWLLQQHEAGWPTLVELVEPISCQECRRGEGRRNQRQKL